MAVGRVEIAQMIERHSKRIDLPMREVFDVRPIGTQAVRVPRLHHDLATVGPLDLRFVREAVAGVNPAIEPPVERTGHSVRVSKADRVVGGPLLIGVAIPVTIDKLPDRRDRMSDHPVIHGRDANRDVQPRRERRHLVGHTIAVRIVNALDPVFSLPLGRREGILSRAGGIEPTGRIKRDVDRLGHVGLGRDEFDLKPLGQAKLLDLLGWSERFGGRDEFDGSILGGKRHRKQRDRHEGNRNKQNQQSE